MSVRYAKELFDNCQDMADIRSSIESRTPYVLVIKKKIERFITVLVDDACP